MARRYPRDSGPARSLAGDLSGERRGLLEPSSHISLLLLYDQLGAPRSHDIDGTIHTLMILFDRKPLCGSFPVGFEGAMSFLIAILRTRQLSLAGVTGKMLNKGLFLALLGLAQ